MYWLYGCLLCFLSIDSVPRKEVLAANSSGTYWELPSTLGIRSETLKTGRDLPLWWCALRTPDRTASEAGGHHLFQTINKTLTVQKTHTHLWCKKTPRGLKIVWHYCTRGINATWDEWCFLAMSELWGEYDHSHTGPSKNSRQYSALSLIGEVRQFGRNSIMS